MRSLLLAGVGIVLACGLSGCGNDAYEKSEAGAKDMIKAMNEIADALETVKDKDTAKKAAPKIEQAANKMEEIGKTLGNLKLTKAQDDKLTKELEPEMNKAAARLQKVTAPAAAACEKEEAFMKSMLRLESAGKSLQKIGKQ
jgi:ABC-type transporter Mla subunit MlaD